MKDKRTPFKETEQTSVQDSDMADVKTRKGKNEKVENKTSKRNKEQEGIESSNTYSKINLTTLIITLNVTKYYQLKYNGDQGVLKEKS